MSETECRLDISLLQLLPFLPGVSTNKRLVLNHLVNTGLLRKSGALHRPAGAAEHIEFKGSSPSLVLTKDGVLKLYSMYRKGELPMRDNWNGSFITYQELMNNLRQAYVEKVSGGSYA